MKYFFSAATKIIKEPGLRIWNLGSELFLAYSSKNYYDEHGLIFGQGWQLCSDAKDDPYYVFPRKLSRETAKKLLYGTIIETQYKKRLPMSS